MLIWTISPALSTRTPLGGIRAPLATSIPNCLQNTSSQTGNRSGDKSQQKDTKHAPLSSYK